MGAFIAPLLVISGATLYFLGVVLPFALVYSRRWSGWLQELNVVLDWTVLTMSSHTLSWRCSHTTTSLSSTSSSSLFLGGVKSRQSAAYLFFAPRFKTQQNVNGMYNQGMRTHLSRLLLSPSETTDVLCLGCQTQGPWAECGPPRHFMRPLLAWKTHDRLYVLCFYFEVFKLNGFVLYYKRNVLVYNISALEWTTIKCKESY